MGIAVTNATIGIHLTIADIARTGMYDRSKCNHDAFAQLPGLAVFRPDARGSTAIQGWIIGLLYI